MSEKLRKKLKIKCKKCGSLLIDLETLDGNYVITRDVDIITDDLLNQKVEFGERRIVCTVCGREIKESTLKKLGIEVNFDEWEIFPKRQDV